MSRRILSSVVKYVSKDRTLVDTSIKSVCLSQSSEYGKTSQNGWTWGLGALLGSMAIAGTAHMDSSPDTEENPSKQQGWHLLDASTRRRTFYKYERRIRDLSQPDKVFHYFATRSLDDGTRVMTANDLICALIAVFPPEESKSDRSGGLAGEPKKPASKRQRLSGSHAPNEGTFLAAFDSDLDGISYSEYILLKTFLRFPAQDVNTVFRMFDLDSSGMVDQQEFEQIVDALQKKLKRGVSVQRTGSDLKMSDSSAGLKERFFGPDGTKTLCLKDFSAFIEGLHEEMLRLEFEHYDIDQDETILGLDFARSILSAVKLSNIDLYLDRAANLPAKYKDCRVDYTEFRHFASLYQHVHTLAVALDFFLHTKGRLERSDFKHATKIVTGTAISDNLVEIVYGLFDLDGDGNLSTDELITVLRKREAGNSSNDDRGSQTLFSCFYDCAFKDR